MRVYVSVEAMRSARRELGRGPGDFTEALVATGIDALFALLDGETVTIGGKAYRLVAEGDTDE